MAGLEVKAEETSAVAKVEEVVGEVVQGVVETGKAVVEGAKGQVTGGGGGKGKKKKGKKWGDLRDVMANNGICAWRGVGGALLHLVYVNCIWSTYMRKEKKTMIALTIRM